MSKSELDEVWANWRELIRDYVDAVDAKVNILNEYHSATTATFHAELAEIRDAHLGLANAFNRRMDELHTRVDEIASTGSRRVREV